MSKKRSAKSKGGKSTKNAYVVPLSKPADQPLLTGVVQLATGSVAEPEQADEVSMEVLDALAERYKSLIEETIELLGVEGATKFVLTTTAIAFDSEEGMGDILASTLNDLTIMSEPALEVYRLKVTLVDAPCKITRTIDVPDCSLGYLHLVLQDAMGWTDSHLHVFEVGSENYGPTLGDDGGMPAEWDDECVVLLSELIGASKKKKFDYIYDFGDDWKHQIEVVSRTKVEKRPACAVCIEGDGAGPPEDVGGVWGCGEMLERLKSGKLEEYDFLETNFDPKKFDLGYVNRSLKKLKWKEFH